MTVINVTGVPGVSSFLFPSSLHLPTRNCLVPFLFSPSPNKDSFYGNSGNVVLIKLINLLYQQHYALFHLPLPSPALSISICLHCLPQHLSAVPPRLLLYLIPNSPAPPHHCTCIYPLYNIFVRINVFTYND